MICALIFLSGIYSCKNLFPFLIMPFGNFHLIFTVFGIILNFLCESLLLLLSGASNSDEFVSDESSDDGDGDLFLLADIFLNFDFSFFMFYKGSPQSTPPLWKLVECFGAVSTKSPNYYLLSLLLLHPRKSGH